MKSFLRFLILAVLLPLSARASNFAFDTFADASGTNINSRSMSVGGTWTQTTYLVPSATIKTDGSGAVYATDANSFYIGTTGPASAQYTMSTTVNFVSVLTSDQLSLCGHVVDANNYYYINLGYSSGWQVTINKRVAGSFINLQTYNLTGGQIPTTSSTHTMAVRFNSGTIEALYDGSVVATQTGYDGALTGAGKFGFGFGWFNTTSTGMHLNDLSCNYSTLTAGTITQGTITSTTASVTSGAATGGSGSYTYQWQRRSPSGSGTFTNVSGATSLTLNDTGLSPSTSYGYQMVSSDGIDTVNSAESALNTGLTYTTVAVTNTGLYFSPYNSDGNGSGTLQSNNVLPSSTKVTWNMPGAYLKFSITIVTTSDVRLLLDTTTQSGIASAACAQISWFYDKTSTTTRSTYQCVYSASQVTVTLASSLAAGTYNFFVYFKGWPDDNGSNIGTIFNNVNDVLINGLSISTDATINTYTPLSKRCLIYGDSDSDGTRILGFTSTIADSEPYLSWIPPCMKALGCEYGTVCRGGWGWTNALDDNSVGVPSTNWPALYSATTAQDGWKLYSVGRSRITVTGQPAPDYIINHLGANDSSPRVALTNANALAWFAEVRAVWPNALIFCSTNASQNNAAAVQSAVTAQQGTGDTKVFYFLPNNYWSPNAFGTSWFYSFDGVHPNFNATPFYGANMAQLIQQKLGSSGTTAGGF